MGKFSLVVLLVVGIILLVRNWDDESTADSIVESETAEESEPIKEPTTETEPAPPPKQPITKVVRVQAADGKPIVVLCEKVSDVVIRLPAPYGEGLRGIEKARVNGWCIGADQGDLLKVTDDYHDVHRNPVDNWPSWFPYLIKVITEDDKEWWVREDSLNEDTVVMQ